MTYEQKESRRCEISMKAVEKRQKNPWNVSRKMSSLLVRRANGKRLSKTRFNKTEHEKNEVEKMKKRGIKKLTKDNQEEGMMKKRKKKKRIKLGQWQWFENLRTTDESGWKGCDWRDDLHIWTRVKAKIGICENKFQNNKNNKL